MNQDTVELTVVRTAKYAVIISRAEWERMQSALTTENEARFAELIHSGFGLTPFEETYEANEE